MVDVKKIRKLLEVIRRSCSLIEEELGESVSIEEVVKQTVQTQSVASPPPQPDPKKDPAYLEYLIARKKHVSDLMAIDCWPPAVPEFALLQKVSDKDNANRASAVLDTMVNLPLEGLDCLDFGCGEGWVTNELMNRGVASATGFDIVQYEKWEEHKGIFTTNEKGLTRYDMIFLIDVLDHSEDPINVMRLVKRMLKPGGVVYVRCHPWTSKHGTHVFKQGLNKAYIHLFLTNDEIAELGYKQIYTRVEKNPLAAQKLWFQDFSIEKTRKHADTTLHDFFLVKAFKDLLISELEIEPARHEAFFEDMKIMYMDYVLK